VQNHDNNLSKSAQRCLKLLKEELETSDGSENTQLMHMFSAAKLMMSEGVSDQFEASSTEIDESVTWEPLLGHIQWMIEAIHSEWVAGFRSHISHKDFQIRAQGLLAIQKLLLAYIEAQWDNFDVSAELGDTLAKFGEIISWHPNKQIQSTLEKPFVAQNYEFPEPPSASPEEQQMVYNKLGKHLNLLFTNTQIPLLSGAEIERNKWKELMPIRMSIDTLLQLIGIKNYTFPADFISLSDPNRKKVLNDLLTKCAENIWIPHIEITQECRPPVTNAADNKKNVLSKFLDLFRK